MTTRRKPLPRSSPAFVDIEPVRPSTSGATSWTNRAIRDHDLTLRQLQSDDNYFNLLDEYHSDTREEDRPPSYQEYSAAGLSRCHEIPSTSLRLQLRPSRSTSVLCDDAITMPSPQSDISDTPLGLSNLSLPTTSPLSEAARGSRPKLVTAVEETSIFLGGLISHPTQSTKHFTILRHSHGLVYYKGPETSLAISIFSSQPLPSSHHLWLQLKGWSGNTGMAAKALFGSNDSWINVTPENQVSADNLRPLDERAWQRDIRKFIAKATKTQQKHVLRETAVIRIPFDASDGYFRLVLTTCDSKNVLCPSPVFRVASTSMSASCLKGASLTTLPIELGVRAVQTAASVVVSKATGAATPWTVVAKNRVANSTPLKKYGGHVQTAWDVSGMQEHVNVANQQYKSIKGDRPVLDRTVSAPATLSNSVVGEHAGPVTPFPIRLSGAVVKGTGSSTTTYDMPTANLDEIPPDKLSSISTGVYFGWAFVVPQEKAQLQIHGDWRQAIITISFTTSNVSRIAQRKAIRAYLLHEFPPNTIFIGSKLKLVIMGYLRPLTRTNEQEVFVLETVNDIAITRASLARPAWGHEPVLQRAKTAQAERSISDRLVDIRIIGQRQVDKIPVHMLGVRSETVGRHDRGMYGNGGVWVKRD